MTSNPMFLRRRVFQLFLLPLLAIFALLPAWGQFDSASVLGTVKDPSGAAIPTATVQLLNIAKGITVTRQSDGNGDYEFPNVQPGDYSITVTAPGFQKAQTDRFTVTVGARQRVALVLNVGAEAQSVEVSGVASQLETDTSDRGRDGADPGSRQPAAEWPRVRRSFHPRAGRARVLARSALSSQPGRLL